MFWEEHVRYNLCFLANVRMYSGLDITNKKIFNQWFLVKCDFFLVKSGLFNKNFVGIFFQRTETDYMSNHG